MMTRFYLATLAAFALVLVAIPATAQEDSEQRELIESREFSKVGVGTGTFLQVPVGARATGLGGAFSAIADDPTAVYWNPAGITQTKGTAVTGAYTALFGGIAHNFAAVTLPVGESNKLGVSLLSLSSGDIPVTTMFTPEGTGGFYSASDLAIGVTFAGQLTDQFSYGATGKVVSMSIADVSATGVAFDFGTLYDPGFLGLRLAFVVSNLSAPVQYSGPGLVERGNVDQTTGNRDADVEVTTNSVSLPLIFRAGLSADLMEESEDHDLIAATEFSTTSNAPEHFTLGAEYVWKDLLMARAAYQLGSPDAFGLSGGIGLKYESGPFWAVLDYAVRPHATMGIVNTISATVRLR